MNNIQHLNNDTCFKVKFYDTINIFAKSDKQNTYTYRIRAYKNENNWNGKIDLTKLRIIANNDYDCWLKFYKIYEQHSCDTQNLYNRQCVEEIGSDFCDDNGIPHTIENYVNAFIINFAENDTLWLVK
jgi:hypothetical protein